MGLCEEDEVGVREAEEFEVEVGLALLLLDGERLIELLGVFVEEIVSVPVAVAVPVGVDVSVLELVAVLDVLGVGVFVLEFAVVGVGVSVADLEAVLVTVGECVPVVVPRWSLTL